MTIFGRKTARGRLRRATRESLAIPAFSSPIDCTPWVIGGVWPAELSPITAETATIAKYLEADLQRIVDSANEQLSWIRRAGLAEAVRQAEEARVINGARAFAVRRVESSVRHLHRAAQEPPTEDPPEVAEVGTATEDSQEQRPENTKRGRHAAIEIDQDDDPRQPIDSANDITPAAEPEDFQPDTSERTHSSDSSQMDANADSDMDPLEAVDTDAAEASSVEVTQTLQEIPAEVAERSHVEADAEPEPDAERLHRLLQFVARQEPGLRWAVGDREDGTTVLVTDLAHGWIPSGIVLPDGVRLLEPMRRSGNAAALLGPTRFSATYVPGDPLGWATDFGGTKSTSQPRALPAVDDLGWVLSEATHWRDGLPRMAHTLAKAGAAETGIIEAEVDVLRVHLDTARYQLVGQYPDVDPALLLNCLLLAATEGIATRDRLSANYHFAWFQRLSAPAASKWTPDR